MMRKTLFMAAALVLLGVTSVGAQAIDRYSTWWDGHVLYTMTGQEAGRLRFDGYDQFGSSFGCHFCLVPTGKAGEYALAWPTKDDVPIDPRCQAAAKVNHLTIGADEYLVVRRPQTGAACFTLRRLGADADIEAALQKQVMLEAYRFGAVCADEVLNAEYLRQKPKKELRLLRNEILARHGYRFQSKDLQEHFRRQSWYTPGTDNNAIRLNTAEQLNLEMIKSEEALDDMYRVEGDADQSYFVSPNEKNEYVVHNTEEFVANLGSNRTIVIPTNVRLDLEKLLADEETYAEIAGFLKAVKAGGELGTVFRENLDGGDNHLVLKNMSGLTICDGDEPPVYISGTTAYIMPNGNRIKILKASDAPRRFSHFEGLLDGRIKVDIVWEETGDRLTAGKILYPNASSPSPILLVGHQSIAPTGQKLIFLTEYAANGAVTGYITLSIEMAEQYELQIGHWIDPKTNKSMEITCTSNGIDYGAENTLPAWYGESVLTPEDPGHIGKYYSYQEWNEAEGRMMGGHISFRAAGQGRVAFECVNAPHNMAESQSAPGRPAVLHDNQFDYADINECGYAIRATFYKQFVSIETTSGPFSTRCFGTSVSLEGTYIKTKD